MASFINRKVFEDKVEQERVLTWKELPTDGTIWRIDKIKEYQGHFDRAAVLTIVNEHNEKKFVRVTIRMLKEIDEKKQSGGEKLYFKTLGQSNDTGKPINLYELVCI